MLAHALRTNGYAAIVRTEPQDKFLHVQVGPFPTRDQAKAMRARLLGDGYNAFIKP
jgi:cell division septation protein DedD